MELHGVDEPRFLDLVRRLKTRFYLVNLHFNNFGCNAESAPMPSRAYQVLWVNKRVGVLDPDAPVPAPPSPLNAPDGPTCPTARLGLLEPCASAALCASGSLARQPPVVTRIRLAAFRGDPDQFHVAIPGHDRQS